MKSKLFILIIFFSLFGELGFCQKSKPGEDVNTRLLFILDASRSMMGRWERGSKMDIAKRIMNQFLDSLHSIPNKNFELALRVYGHQSPVPPQNCNDTKLEVAFGENNIGDIKRTIRGISAKGTTPIAHSIALSANDFPECENCRNIIVLLTDGVEACDGDPCQAAMELRRKGVTLKPFVIGVGLNEEDKQSLECIGNFYDASDEATFQKVLKIVVDQALNNTTAQVSLMNHQGKPKETNVPITFYSKISNQVDLQFMHTLNKNGVPDTFYLDPLVNYSMTVHSIPERHLDSIDIKTGVHNQIKVPLAQGNLKVYSNSLSRYLTPLVVVREAGQSKILNVQPFNQSATYLKGIYDLEILTLPRIYFHNYKISGGQNHEIEVETPGIISFTVPSSGYGSILMTKNGMEHWVTDIDEESTRHSIILQPGDYTLVFRSKSSQSSSYSKVKNFTIQSGLNTIININ